MMSAGTSDQSNTPLRAAEWVSISAYARIHQIDRVTVYKWIQAGLLVYYRVGAVVRIKNQPPTC